MKIFYFAKLRQVAGRGSEEVELPDDVQDVIALIAFLSGRDESVAAALSDLRTLKVAINQKQANLNSSLVGATEVAFFPPVTGG